MQSQVKTEEQRNGGWSGNGTGNMRKLENNNRRYSRGEHQLLFPHCNPTKFHLLFDGDFDIIICIGVWRSLVARSAGGREVASSNLVTPIFI